MLYIINLKPEFKINTTLTVITKARDIRDNKKYLIEVFIDFRII